MTCRCGGAASNEVQLYDTPPLKLASIANGQGNDASANFSPFLVQVPDSRLRVTSMVVGTPDVAPSGAVPIPFDLTNGAAINVKMHASLKQWMRGTSGLYIPILDLIGTVTAYQSLPAGGSVMGFVLSDGQTGVSHIFGSLSLQVVAGPTTIPSHTYYAMARYTPAVHMEPHEWRAATQGLQITPVGANKGGG